MACLRFEGAEYETGGLSVLDCLTAAGHAVPSSCRAGVCQSCLMQVTSGAIPPAAQAGLQAGQIAQDLFLACQCQPDTDIEVGRADRVLPILPATVIDVTSMNRDIRRLRLRPARSLDYRAGQFVRLHKNAAQARNYSLASVPALDRDLELHIRRIPGGVVSSWLCDEVSPGQVVEISEARGNCFLVPGTAAQDLLLLGTGSGLAPLLGIARDALHRAHCGRIHLYHGSRDSAGLYLQRQLRRMAARHPGFSYTPCVTQGRLPTGGRRGSPLDAALADHPDLGGWLVFLCGNPNMVEAARIASFLAGASSAHIYADPFLTTGDPKPSQ